MEVAGSDYSLSCNARAAVTGEHLAAGHRQARKAAPAQQATGPLEAGKALSSSDSQGGRCKPTGQSVTGVSGLGWVTRSNAPSQHLRVGVVMAKSRPLCKGGYTGSESSRWLRKVLCLGTDSLPSAEAADLDFVPAQIRH